MSDDIDDEDPYDSQVIPLPGMETFDAENPWKNISFSRIHHGKKFKFPRKKRDNIVRAKLNDSNQHIFVKQLIDTSLITKISIEFTILNHVENSIIGLLEYPLQYTPHNEMEDEKQMDIKSVGIYGDKALEYTAFKDIYYGVGTSEFSGTENVFRRWSPAHAQTKRLTMDFGFGDGDTLIMVIDGDERECSVYVNQINDRYLIRNQLKSKQYTFKNIPQQFILVYGAHAVDMDDIDTAHASHVEVEVRLLQLIPKKQMDKGNAEEAVEDEEDVDEYEHEYADNIDVKAIKTSNNHLGVSTPTRPRSKSAEPSKKRKKRRRKRKSKNKNDDEQFADIGVATDGELEMDDVDLDVDIDIDDYDWTGFKATADDSIRQFRRKRKKRTRDDDEDSENDEAKDKDTAADSENDEDSENEEQQHHHHKKKHNKHRHKKKKKPRRNSVNPNKKRKHRKHRKHNDSDSDDSDDLSRHHHHKKHKKKKRRRRHSHHSNALQERADEKQKHHKRKKRKKKKKKKKRRHSHNSNVMQEMMTSDDDEENNTGGTLQIPKKKRTRRRHTHNSNALKEMKDTIQNDTDASDLDSEDSDAPAAAAAKRRRNSYDRSDALQNSAGKYRSKHAYKSRLEVATPVSPSDKMSAIPSLARSKSLSDRSKSCSPPPSRGESCKPAAPRNPPPSSVLRNAHHALDESEMQLMATDECYLIEKCIAVKRMTIALEFYQKILNQMHNKEDVIDIYCTKYKHLLNDYHHILKVHFNGGKKKKENDSSFGLVFDSMTSNIECNIRRCGSFKRNNEQKKKLQLKNEFYKRVTFCIGILDTIHCLFVHSYDGGFKLRAQDDTNVRNDECYEYYGVEEEEKGADERMVEAYTDDTLKHINERLSSQHELLSSLRSPFDNKFENDFCDGFGDRFYYWPFYRDNKWYVAPKYCDFKSELLQNKICALNAKEYEFKYFCASMFVDTAYVRRDIKRETEYAMYATKERICSRENVDELVYDVKEKTITTQHILSVVLFTDCVSLRNSFCQTFCDRDRHREFHHWAKLLRESVEIYGEWIANEWQSFYTSLPASNEWLLDRFCGCIAAPISSTTELSVVSVYNNDDATSHVLELSLDRDSPCGLFIKYFSCCFVSSSSYENEAVFVGGWAPLRFESLICVPRSANYCCFFDAMKILEVAMNGQKQVNKARDIDYLIIDKLIRFELNLSHDTSLPQYPTQMFDALMRRRVQCTINIGKMSIWYPKLKKYFISPPLPTPNQSVSITNIYENASSTGDNNDNNSENTAEMPVFEYITTLCPQCVEICVQMSNAKNCITRSFLSRLAAMMKKINKTKLETIRFENIRNRCSDKDLKRFQSFITTQKKKKKKKKKSDWSINIITEISNDDRTKQKYKYQYDITKNKPARSSLMNKMKNMFANKNNTNRPHPV